MTPRISFPLCETALAQLEGQHIGYTWPNAATGEPLTWLDDTLHTLVERATKRGPAVPRFSLHDLRSTGATWLRNAGVDPLIIKHLMGHSLKTGDVTDSYTKIFETSMREAVAIFNEKFKPIYRNCRRRCSHCDEAVAVTRFASCERVQPWRGPSRRCRGGRRRPPLVLFDWSDCGKRFVPATFLRPKIRDRVQRGEFDRAQRG